MDINTYSIVGTATWHVSMNKGKGKDYACPKSIKHWHDLQGVYVKSLI